LFASGSGSAGGFSHKTSKDVVSKEGMVHDKKRKVAQTFLNLVKIDDRNLTPQREEVYLQIFREVLLKLHGLSVTAEDEQEFLALLREAKG